jgi:hypothetical protein
MSNLSIFVMRSRHSVSVFVLSNREMCTAYCVLPCEWLRFLTVYVLREMRDAMGRRQCNLKIKMESAYSYSYDCLACSYGYGYGGYYRLPLRLLLWRFGLACMT